MKKFSIIIPVFNSEKYIGKCLSALQNLEFNKEQYEIIVVDNGSTDKTVEIVGTYPVQLHVLPKVTISKLRNFGAQKAEGEVFAFIDGDCIAPRCWLSKSLEFLLNNKAGAVGSWYKLPDDASLIEEIWDALSIQRRKKSGLIDWVPSSNLIIPSSIFKKINGFDEALTTAEDVDICYRLRQEGFSVYSYPEIAVIHLDNPKTLRSFFMKEKWRGEGVLQNLIHEFPYIKWNKAIIFTGVTFLSLICFLVGIYALFFYKSSTIILFAIAALFAIPLCLSFKTCFSNQQWKYFLPLTFLFVIYACARICSAINPKVWQK